MIQRTAAPRRKSRMIVRKNCRLCEGKVTRIDFKDTDMIRKFQTEKGKILPRRISGNCCYHQKMLAKAVKNARTMALVF